MILTTLMASFLILLALGVPIAISLVLSSAVVFVSIMDMSLVVIIQRLFNTVDSFTYLAIPFFMLAGSLMSAGGVTKRIVDFSLCLVGMVAGGLALVVCIAGMFFAALSGSTAATTAAIGASMIEEMEKRGYAQDFAAAVVAASGTVGIVIPPSITMVVYGATANVSIADLFMGGFLPGFLMVGTMCLLSWVISRRNGWLGTGSFSFRRIGKAFIECFWALMMPVIILGGIYSGVFTPTESAAAAAVYGAFVGAFVYRELTWAKLPKVLLSAATASTLVMFVIAGAGVFGWVLTTSEVPQQLAKEFIALTDNRITFLMIINVLLLFMGCLMNPSAAVVILIPVLMPVLQSLDINLVFFGVLMVVNLSIGCITPPVGTDLFVVSSITGLPMDAVVKRIMPYIGVLILDLLLLTYFDGIIMFLPNLMAG